MSKDALANVLTREMERIAKHTENWVERMNAVAEIRRQFEALEPSAASSLSAEIWKILKPLKTMVQDLRSQIVKEVCSLLTLIASITRDAMVPFVREMLPNLVEVRGSGNKVCGSYCSDCVDALVSYTVVKGATLKVFVDTIVESKNKLIRLTCISSLKLAVVNWSAVLDKMDVQNLEKGLKAALHDPSSSCRSVAYEFFTVFQQKFPKRAALLMAIVDYKIQKRLEQLVSGESSLASSRYAAADLPPPTPLNAMPSYRRPPPSIADSSASVDDNGATNGATSDQPPGATTFELGDRVCIPDKELFGFVRFTGEIEGVRGAWIGIELDEPFGKNDGSVKGRYYFRCKSKHGVFARPHQVFLTISGSKLMEQGGQNPAPVTHPKQIARYDSARTLDESFDGGDDRMLGEPSDDAVEAALNLELGSLQLTPDDSLATGGAPASAMGSVDLADPSALQLVLTKASVAHRKFLVRLLQLVQTELHDHQQFDTYMSTASSADAVQYLQQLQNSAQDKIVLSDQFIQHMIQAQQAARES